MRHDFWGLISAHKIIIPSIQRDYAQGRETSAATAIRTKFLEEILNSMRENKPLYLDFVYGKLKGLFEQEVLLSNRKNLENILASIKGYAKNIAVEFNYDLGSKEQIKAQSRDFIPLDGQQRLTTLFVVHWYVLFRLGDAGNLAKLSGFSYQTRSSSADFMKEICDLDFMAIKQDFEVLSTELINQKNFFKSWMRDPTVKGILVVLDLIHSRLKDADTADFEKYWQNLTVGKCIEFDFLNLEKLELSDELYVRMNARGKQLSDFENFKAWLFKELKNRSVAVQVKDWKIKFDVAWTDLFWNSKAPHVFELDDVYLQYFKLNYMADYVKSLSVSDGKFVAAQGNKLAPQEDIGKYLDDLRSSKPYFDTEVSFSNVLFFENIESYLLVLEYISSDPNFLQDLVWIGGDPMLNFWNKYVNCSVNDLLFGSRSTELNWWQSSLYYGILGYVSLVDMPLSDYDAEAKIEFQRYCRVLMNLVFNIRIESGNVYKQVAEGIDQLLDAYGKQQPRLIYELLADGSTGSFGFTAIQVKEERLKASLILQDPLWERQLVLAENNVYFYGQVEFIIALANSELTCFTEYASRLNILFSEIVLVNPEHLLQRALLTKGDYLMDKGLNSSFCLNAHGTVRERNENWRLVFAQQEKVRLLEQLITDELFNTQDIISSLNAIISKDAVSVDDYLKKFIEIPRLMDYCGVKQIRLSDENPGANVYLLKSTTIRGYYPELHTMAIYEVYRLRFLKAYQLSEEGENFEQWKFDEFFKSYFQYRYTKGLNDESALLVHGLKQYMISYPLSRREFVISCDGLELMVTENEQEVYRFIDPEIRPVSIPFPATDKLLS